MVAVETDAVVALVCGFSGESEGLAVFFCFAKRVLDVDVVNGGVGGPVSNGAGSVV